MAPKRKAPKKKTAKTARSRAPTTPHKKTVQPPAPGNASTPSHPHPYTHLSFSARRTLDATDYGFKNTPIPATTTTLPRLRLLRPTTTNLPDNPATVTPLMQIMQNKLFHVREYFLPEVKALIWGRTDRGPRTASEKALLAEAARGIGRGGVGGGLGISPCAVDCVRLILCCAVIFEMEDREGKGKGGEEGFRVEERKADLEFRAEVWEKLRREIGEQLPGDRKVREERAEVVLRKVFRLACEEDGSEVVGVGRGVGGA
ncbi:hypothetical protein P171DRAFT_438378 [Karstenula rhodostoma CBS 690.94]|uniref:Uncharacterized protein n=1 Tax=Karstenula rhodostoma CBS 690.94 TaxID=1392251 RepID=A0A9P4UJG8_9PLEO|nr:hypothetical protein P171DRAFT_438378 [Karstenula rhodostoma CBS 690.94]